MSALAGAAGLFCLVAVALHVTVAGIVVWRNRRSCRTRTPLHLPPVTIIRPLCGVDAHEAAMLRSAFQLDYPDYELILCCASASDPVLPLARQVMAEHPHVDARLLIGNDRISDNPKLNNMVKGWHAARHDWIVMADSNVLMPRDYLHSLLDAWREDTGLVCAPPVGTCPGSCAAELECAFLNTYQASWQYAANAVGLGFAQGKTMLWRREVLEAGGGIASLGSEAAEDAAATKLVRAQGLRIRLARVPSLQPLGLRTLAHVWRRQVRWARLRRASFPLFFAPEVLTGSVPALASAMLAAQGFDADPVLAVMVVAAAWYGVEACTALAAGWHLSWLSPLAWMLRDLLLPLLWMQAWAGRSFIWRGNDMQAVRAA